jgi:hypothetical protein
MMAARDSFADSLARNTSPVVLCGAIALIVIGTAVANSAVLDRTVTEALIRIVYVVGLYIFVGNSGVISFGHTAFMAVGAYATAWQDCCSATKALFMPALPKFLLETTVPPSLATIVLRRRRRRSDHTPFRNQRVDCDFRGPGDRQRYIFQLGLGHGGHQHISRHSALH